MEKSVFYDELATVVLLVAAADNSAYNGAEVDMQGYDGVCFIATVGKGAITTSVLKVQQDAVTGMGAAADLAGSAQNVVTAVATDGIAMVDVAKPIERFLRPVLTVPDITAVPACVVAIRYRGQKVPVGNTGKFLLSPAEGTA